MLAHARGIPDALAALAFMAGAVLGFAFGGATARFDRDHGETLLIWGGGACASSRWGSRSGRRRSWPLGGFLYTTAYLLVAGAEATAAYEWDHRREP